MPRRDSSRKMLLLVFRRAQRNLYGGNAASGIALLFLLQLTAWYSFRVVAALV